MGANDFLWNPPDEKCHFLRLRTNELSFKNFWQWRRWWEVLTKERHQQIVVRSDNKSVLECIVYGTRECLITATDLKIKGIPQAPSWSNLVSCKFVNDKGDAVAQTHTMQKTVPNYFNNVQSVGMFELTLFDGTQYIVRENNHHSLTGIDSPYPWVTIADHSGNDFIGARYCKVALGMLDDLIFVSDNQQSNLYLLLGIAAYYACEAGLYRQAT